jgi:hypothetical protein
MKKLITLLLLFTLVGFLSGNQVVITNNYQYIVSEGKTYNFSNGNESNNVKYDRTNKIAIQNNKVLADPLKYHYAFFWDESNSFIGYYKTNKGITTSGEYLGQVNTQSIPLPLNAYSFALVRYDNDYELVPGITIEDIFIDSDNYFDNDIEWNALNNQSTNDVFQLNNLYNNATWTVSSGTITNINNEIIRTIPNALTIDSYRITSNIGRINTNIYYLNYDIKYENIDNVFISATWMSSNSNSITQTYSNISFKHTALSDTSSTFFDFLNNQTTSNQVSLFLKNPKFINLTSLGLTSLTKTNLDNFHILFNNINNNNFIYTGNSTIFIDTTYGYNQTLLNLTEIFGSGNEPDEATMDAYYAAYEEYLDYLYVCCDIFATQTISFETIYFDDGVSTEIEAIGSILIFTIIGFTLMIFGFASKRRIFNLLSIGAFIVLGVLLAEFAGFLIIVFGLVVLNLYYTFLGDI